MARRKAKHTEPASGTDPVSGAGSLPIHTHGPQARPARLFGPERLRQVLDLSPDADTDRLCQDAADEIESLRARPDAASILGQDW